MKKIEIPDQDTIDLHIYMKGIRGDLIASVINLESVMNLFLARHFCGHSEEKITESIEMIFSTTKLTLDNKREIILGIMQKHFVDKKYTQALNKSLQKIIECRNIFAHHEYDGSDKAKTFFRKEKTIQFIKYKNAKIYEPFTTNQISDIKFDIHVTTERLMALIE